VETLDVCRRLWAGEPVTLQGRYVRLDGVHLLPTPHTAGGPPIWMGGEVEAATVRAGRLAEAWMPNSVTPEAWAEGWARVRQAAAGRAVTPALYTTLAVDRDGRRAETRLRRFVETYYAAPYEAIARIQGFHAGDPASCRERLQRFVDAGVRHVVLRFAGGDQDAQLDLVTREILPRLSA
jgi:alkanesulfonate monooxygenase SsuD/methylene tetrahydromethanopterin reductase-like flavin-dependent oxidoreductase (luciferase family)